MHLLGLILKYKNNTQGEMADTSNLPIFIANVIIIPTKLNKILIALVSIRNKILNNINIYNI